jgi:multidrug transporter EmrE-like cation transporter
MPSPKISSSAKPPGSDRLRGHWFWNAYLQISISILLTTASQIFMKLGADHSIHDEWLGFAGLRSGWVWLGIIAMIVGLVSWLHALKTVPLNVAFSLACASHAFVPLSCWFFLGEAIPARRWLGIALVIAGITVIARPLVRLEEKL